MSLYKTIALTITLLFMSNTFMTFAWYGHLKTLGDKFWLWAVLVSWGIAFFEYSLQVPANRIGVHAMTIPQLKIVQEAIALVVFIPFAIFYLKQPLTWNFFWAGLCILGAVYFIFR